MSVSHPPSVKGFGCGQSSSLTFSSLKWGWSPVLPQEENLAVEKWITFPKMTQKKSLEVKFQYSKSMR
jgi:hypothetical protein